MNDRITIHLDALARPLWEQIPQLDKAKAAYFEELRRCLNMVRIHGIVPPSEAKRAEERLIKKIVESLT